MNSQLAHQICRTNLRRLINQEINCIFYRNAGNLVDNSDDSIEQTMTPPRDHEQDQESTMEFLDADLENCTVLCGSFNPLHEGHIKLLEAAHQLSQKEQMVFELSINNKDKGSIDEEQLISRIAPYKHRNLNLIVTQVPMFFEKAKLIRNSCFAIGYDTYVRLLNLKYYKNDIKYLIQELQDQQQNIGTTFAVAGRLNATTKTFEHIQDSMVEKIITDQIGEKNQTPDQIQ